MPGSALVSVHNQEGMMSLWADNGPLVRYLLKAACLKGLGFTESRVFPGAGKAEQGSEQISQRSWPRHSLDEWVGSWQEDKQGVREGQDLEAGVRQVWGATNNPVQLIQIHWGAGGESTALRDLEARLRSVSSFCDPQRPPWGHNRGTGAVAWWAWRSRDEGPRAGIWAKLWAGDRPGLSVLGKAPTPPQKGLGKADFSEPFRQSSVRMMSSSA